MGQARFITAFIERYASYQRQKREATIELARALDAACQADDAPKTTRGHVDWHELHAQLAEAVKTIPDADLLPGFEYCRRIWQAHVRLDGNWDRYDILGNLVSIKALVAARKLPEEGDHAFVEVIKRPGLSVNEVNRILSEVRNAGRRTVGDEPEPTDDEPVDETPEEQGPEGPEEPIDDGEDETPDVPEVDDLPTAGPDAEEPSDEPVDSEPEDEDTRVTKWFEHVLLEAEVALQAFTTSGAYDRLELAKKRELMALSLTIADGLYGVFVPAQRAA